MQIVGSPPATQVLGASADLRLGRYSKLRLPHLAVQHHNFLRLWRPTHVLDTQVKTSEGMCGIEPLTVSGCRCFSVRFGTW